MILPENLRSQAVAHRLGLTLVEERVLSSFTAAAPRHLADRPGHMAASPRSRGRTGRARCSEPGSGGRRA